MMTTRIQSAADQLRNGFPRRAHLARRPGHDPARQVWNSAIDRHPVLMACGCPILPHRGAVQVGELTTRDDLFGEWLAEHLSA